MSAHALALGQTGGLAAQLLISMPVVTPLVAMLLRWRGPETTETARGES